MSRYIRLYFVLISLVFAPAAGMAAPTDPKDAVKELAALSADLANIDTLQRITDDLVFWQSVAIMGGEYDWQFSYNSAGTELVEWTIRLSQSLDQTSHEGARAAQSIKRSRVLTDAEKESGLEVYEIFNEIHTHGKDIHTLLRAGDVALAAKIFSDEVIEKRRQFSRSLVSMKIEINERIKDIGFKVRLGK